MTEPNYPNQIPANSYQSEQGESNLFANQIPVVYSGFGRRFAAYLIDGILLGIIAYIIGTIIGGNETFTQREGFSNLSLRYDYFSTDNMLSTVIGWLYFALMESSAGQATLGKKALNIKVTGMNGERISFLNATGRHFAKILSVIILFIGFLMVLWTDKRQALHDMLAKTVVVKN